jgi:hypothetical protein
MKHSCSKVVHYPGNCLHRLWNTSVSAANVLRWESEPNCSRNTYNSQAPHELRRILVTWVPLFTGLVQALLHQQAMFYVYIKRVLRRHLPATHQNSNDENNSLTSLNVYLLSAISSSFKLIGCWCPGLYWV